MFDLEIKNLGRIELGQDAKPGEHSNLAIAVGYGVLAVAGGLFIWGLLRLISAATVSASVKRLGRAESDVRKASALAIEAMEAHEEALEAGTGLFDEKGRPLGSISPNAREALNRGQQNYKRALQEIRGKGCALLAKAKED